MHVSRMIVKFARQCRVAVSIVPKLSTRRQLFSRARESNRAILFIPPDAKISDSLEKDATGGFDLLYIVLLIYANKHLGVRSRVVPRISPRDKFGSISRKEISSCTYLEDEQPIRVNDQSRRGRWRNWKYRRINIWLSPVFHTFDRLIR